MIDLLKGGSPDRGERLLREMPFKLDRMPARRNTAQRASWRAAAGQLRR